MDNQLRLERLHSRLQSLQIEKVPRLMIWLVTTIERDPVVKAQYLASVVNHGLDQVRPDETGSAGHEYSTHIRLGIFA
jgi:hypothetical protein